MKILKIVGYAFGGAVVASFGVLIVGMFVYGFNNADWTESQGRLVGVSGTIAGVFGAAIGLVMASRAGRQSP